MLPVKTCGFFRKYRSRKLNRHRRSSQSNHFFGKVGFLLFRDYDYRRAESLPILGETDHCLSVSDQEGTPLPFSLSRADDRDWIFHVEIDRVHLWC